MRKYTSLLLRGIKRTNRLSSYHQLALQYKLMLSSAFILAFFGFLHSSEFTSPSSSYFNSLVDLSYSDIRFTTCGSLIKIIQNWSLPEGLFHHDCSLWPVCMCHTGHAPILGSPAFLQCHPSLFLLNRAISHQGQSHFNLMHAAPMLRLCHRVPCLPSHSFCVGAATTPAEATLPPWLIQTLDWWSSNCYIQYIRAPASILQTVPVKLATTHSTPQQSWDPSTGQCRPFKSFVY